MGRINALVPSNYSTDQPCDPEDTSEEQPRVDHKNGFETQDEIKKRIGSTFWE